MTTGVCGLGTLTFSDLNFFGTLGLIAVAWFQIRGARTEVRKDRTLNMCFAYDNDPIISAAVKKVRLSQPLDLHERRTILNYFDVLAIGAKQRNYDRKIIFAQFKNIIPSVSKKCGINEISEKGLYPDLEKLISQLNKKNGSPPNIAPLQSAEAKTYADTEAATKAAEAAEEASRAASSTAAAAESEALNKASNKEPG
jgi:hypothetical protein